MRRSQALKPPWCLYRVQSHLWVTVVAVYVVIVIVVFMVVVNPPWHLYRVWVSSPGDSGGLLCSYCHHRFHGGRRRG